MEQSVTPEISDAIKSLLSTVIIDEVYTEDYQLTHFGQWIAGLDQFMPDWNIRKVLES